MFGSGEPKARRFDPRLRSLVTTKLGEIREDRLRTDLFRFIGPHNRLHSPQAMTRVESLLVDEFARYGWQVERWPFHLENVAGAWDYGDGLPAMFPSLDGTNLVATKRGETSAKEAVVVVAHYDTRRDTPGADDNTASVACLLELARVLSADRFGKSVILVATDMEELLYVGARSLVAELKARYRVVAALILETLAYVDDRPHTLKLESKPGRLYREQWRRMERHRWAAEFTLVLYQRPGSSLAATLGAALELSAGPETSVLARDPGNLPLLGFFLRRMAPGLVRQFHRSDHVPFWEARIPAVQVTDGADFSNPHYHRTTDLPDTIDFQRLAAITAAVAGTVGVHAEVH